MTKMIRAGLAVLLMGSGLLLNACEDVGDDDGNSVFTVDDTGGSETYYDGDVPTGDDGSLASIQSFLGNTTFVPGGSNQFSGDIEGEAATLAVGFEEYEGWFEVNTYGDAFEFVVTLSQDVSEGTLTMVVTPVTADGSAGQSHYADCTVISVGTGDLQVSLSWATETDVDLHLVEPSGEEIWYGAVASSSGGTLDLDSNAGCSIDGVNNENITYEGVTPPSGEYTVRVDYWSACAHTETTGYIVTVFNEGDATTYSGSFSVGDADYGEAGSGTTVTTFSF